MADWTNIANNEIDGDSPITESLMTALRDNPVAITEGASGAPKIQSAALASSAVNNVALGSGAVTYNKLSSSLYTTGAIGTYALLRGSYQINITPGSSYAGSSLFYAGIAFAIGGGTPVVSYMTSGQPPGTWRAMGYGTYDGLDYVLTLFMRIA